MIIAIDGYSATGKSTLAGLLAQKIGFNPPLPRESFRVVFLIYRKVKVGLVSFNLELLK